MTLLPITLDDGRTFDMADADVRTELARGDAETILAVIAKFGELAPSLDVAEALILDHAFELLAHAAIERIAIIALENELDP